MTAPKNLVADINGRIEYCKSIMRDYEPQCSMHKGAQSRLHLLQQLLPKVEAADAQLKNIPAYDAGALNTYGGGNVEWWLDHIRYHLGKADEHYRECIEDILEEPAVAGIQIQVGLDGNMWCALHGEDLQEGEASFGHDWQDAISNFVREHKMLCSNGFKVVFSTIP
jgi:hypothetical protein